MVEFGSTSFTTNAPNPILLFSPIVTPCIIVDPAPINTLSLILTSPEIEDKGLMLQ